MRNKIWVWFVLATIGVLLAGAIPAGAQDGDPLDAIRANYPRVDGSTSARPLQRVIAAEVQGLPWMWVMSRSSLVEYHIMSGLPDREYFITAGLGLADVGKYDRLQAMRAVRQINHNGTHSAYMNLIAGEADLILVARAPSQDERDAAQQAGVALDVQPVAYDAFVFLVNSNNPIESLTLDEIRGVYTGEVTDWSVLGVQEQLSIDDQNSIAAYTRNPNSGSQVLMHMLVMGDLPIIDAPDMIRTGMDGLVNAVDVWSHAIGYSVYFYASFIKHSDHTKLIGVEDVIPTFETIADGSYPLTTEVYAVVRADAASNSPAVLLRNWLLTPDGQGVVAASGYVPLRTP